MIKLEKKFPELPETKASWAPVYIEPILTSGEKITVAIAAVDANGKHAVIPALRSDQVTCAFGISGVSLISSASLCIESLEKHLKINNTLSGWSPPLSGVEIGSIKHTVADDLNSLIRIGMQLTSCFSSLSSKSIENLDQIIKDEDDRWPNQIKEAVISKAPGLLHNFNKRFDIVAGGKTARFDYLGMSYAANFGKLIPTTQRVSKALDDSRTKMWKLMALRDCNHTLSIQSYELILWHPHENDPSYSQKEIEVLKEALYSISEEGRAEGIAARPVYDAEEAAKLITDAEAA